MLEQAARHWWTLGLRGLAAIVFALIAFFNPFSVPLALVLVFGAFALVDGLFALIAASRMSHEDENWRPLIMEGVIGVLFGIVAFASPGGVALALVWLLAAWAILTGALEIAAAVRLRRAVSDEWLLILIGVISVIFGLLLLANPGAGLETLAYILGAYALLSGILLLALSLRLRRLAKRYLRQP